MSKASPDFKKGYLSFGLLLDSDHAFSILDKGPPADDAQVWWKRATRAALALLFIVYRIGSSIQKFLGREVGNEAISGRLNIGSGSVAI